MLCYGLAMPVAGYLAGTRGTRFVLLTGAAIVVASCVWTVNARGPVEFLLAFGVALSVGLGFTSPVALTPVISRWFTRQRGMALFFLSTGSMAGIALMTPLLTHAIAAVGWRETMLGFAALFALVTVPSALFVMRDQAPAHTDLLPHQIVDRPAGAQARPAARAPSTVKASDALASVPFWQIALGLFACGFSMNLLGTHGMPMLMDHGFDASTSALGIGLIGLVAIFSTLVLGRLSDQLERRNILAVIYCARPGLFRAGDGGHALGAVPGGVRGRHRLGRQHRAVLGHPGGRVRGAAGGTAVRPGLPGTPGGRHDQFMAGRLGLRALWHALDRLRRGGRVAAAGGGNRAAAAAARRALAPAAAGG